VSERNQRRQTQRGSELVETALVTIPFFALILGIITAGYLVFTYGTVAFAAQQGARWASVRGASSGSPATAATVQTYVEGQAVGLSSNSLAVQTTWSPNNQPGSTVTVQVTYTATPLASFNFPNSLSLSSSSSTTISQ
jgi:Flp pilus assembly protein TadG